MEGDTGSASSRRPQISDVAHAAGVSPTTVSHALSGARAVNADTRARILEVAARLGYAPDRLASGLRKRRTGLVGFVGDRVSTTPFAGRMIAGARASALEADVLMLVAESDGDPMQEQDAIERLLAQRIDGLILSRMYHQRVVRPAMTIDVPVVLVDAAPARGWHVDAVVPDEAQIAVAACDVLLEAGHREIGYAGTTDETRASRARLLGVRATLGDHGIALPAHRRAAVSSDASGGRSAGGYLLDAADPPTAIVCFNDQIAMGVMQAATRRGLSVPADLSVVGVDDLPVVADALDPALTTVALPHAEMGSWGMRRLLDLVNRTHSSQVQTHLMPGRLIKRGSIAPPSHAS